MNGQEARIQRFAPVYRSFPIDWVRQVTRGKTLSLIGSVNDGLVKSLEEASVSASMMCIDAATSVQRDRFERFLRGSDRADWTIVTDPDVASTLTSDPDLLFSVRQRTREILLFPMPFSTAEMRPATSGFDGMSAAETAGNLHWRWITSADGKASFLLWSSYARDDLVLTFTPWFSTSFRERGLLQAQLSITDAAGSRTLSITDNQSVSVDIQSNAGATLIDVGSDISPVARDTDTRTLSLAMVQPSLSSDEGTLIGPEDFIAGRGGPLLMQTRKLLHRFGFAVVAGRACGVGHIGAHRPVPPSFGTPLRSMWEAHDPLPQAADIIPAAGEVVWLTAGERPYD